MKKSVLFFGCWFLMVSAGYAELVGLWTFDGATGLEMTAGAGHTGIWANLGDGVLVGGNVSRATDPEQGQVWQFAPVSGQTNGCIDLGTLPVIDATAATDFTFSFWTKNFSTNTQTMVGNRNGGADSGGKYSFFKLTPSRGEFQNSRNGGSGAYITYSTTPASDGTWQFYTVTKATNKLTVHLDGVPIGQTTISGTLNATDSSSGGMKWYLGGSGANRENWTGSLNNFAFRNDALTASQVRMVYNKVKSVGRESLAKAQAATSGGKMVIVDDFNTTEQTLTKGSPWTNPNAASNITWNVKEIGLENRTGAYTSNVQANVETGASEYGGTNGILRIAGDFGTNTTSHWSGASLQSVNTYTATAETPVIFSVDRLYLSQANKAARSSIWLWNSSSNYVHLSQNTENPSGNNYAWTYNIGGTNSATSQGRRFGFYDDLNSHEMTLKYDGTNVWMYADGKLVGMDTANLGSFQVMVTGQSWGSSEGSVGTVDTAFDDPTVTTLAAVNSDIPISDNFTTMEVSPRWSLTSATEVFSKMTRTNPDASTTDLGTGILSIQNTNSAAYGQVVNVNGLGIRVSRDSMDFSSIDTEAGLKLTNQDGSQTLSVSQNNDGYWNLGWDGITVKSVNDVAVAGDSEELYLGDFFQTQILLESMAVGEDTLFTLSLDDNTYRILTSGWDAAVIASLYALGDGAYAGFDNFGITGAEVPEPAGWTLLLLGLLGFGFRRKK